MPQKIKVEVEIPDWVNWIAIDKNGWGHGYRVEPTPSETQWICGKEGDPRKPSFTLLYKGPAPKNWKTELYHWR